MTFDGTWDVTMKTPMGDRKGKFILSQDGASLSGKMSSDEGELDIINGKVNGDTASWDVNATSPMPITLSFTGQSSGTEISGEVKFGGFGSGSFTGTQA